MLLMTTKIMITIVIIIICEHKHMHTHSLTHPVALFSCWLRTSYANTYAFHAQEGRGHAWWMTAAHYPSLSPAHRMLSLSCSSRFVHCPASQSWSLPLSCSSYPQWGQGLQGKIAAGTYAAIQHLISSH